MDLGHAHIVPSHQLRPPDPHFYLPVHGVFKDSSTTTKVRAVFDASARTSSTFSLNDTLLPGPNLYPPLTDILLRFRKFPIAMSADISKMFREILLNPTEKDLKPSESIGTSPKTPSTSPFRPFLRPPQTSPRDRSRQPRQACLMYWVCSLQPSSLPESYFRKRGRDLCPGTRPFQKTCPCLGPLGWQIQQPLQSPPTTLPRQPTHGRTSRIL